MMYAQWKGSIRLKAFCSAGVLLTLILLGVLYLKRASFIQRGGPRARKIVEKDNADVPLDYCQFARTMDAYWGCLVDGPTEYYKPAVNEKDTDSNDWGYHTYKRKEILDKPELARGDRKKRDTKQSQNFNGPYTPLNDTYRVNFTALTDAHFTLKGANDPFFHETPFLYKQLGATSTNIKQRNPPWSYHGDNNPKRWHTLEIEKFLVPVQKSMSVEQASLLDHWIEYHWATDTEFRNLWYPVRGYLYFNPSKPEEPDVPPIAEDNDYPEKHMSLIPVEPNGGYYSFMRFTLPPPITEKEVKELIRQGVLKTDFTLPDGTRVLPDFMGLLNQFQKHIRDDFPDIFPVVVHFLYQANYEYLDKYNHLFDDTVQFPLDDVNSTTMGIILESMIHVVKYEYEPQREDLKRRRGQISLPLMPRRFPICEGKEPSPLDIVTNRALVSSLKPYQFTSNFNLMYPILMFFEDDGTTLLEVIFVGAERLLGRSIGMTGGAVKGTELFFEILHIKFGTNKDSGSEHRINGKSYGMELQFIFSNKGTDPKNTYFHTLARMQSDLFPFREKLIIILAVLVEVVPKEKAENPFLFEPLTQAAYKFREQRAKFPNGEFNETYRQFISDDYVMRLSDFIPDSTFYTYRGSLTIPPCFSYVIWSVYEKPLQITEEQFLEFTMMPAVGRDDTNHVAGNIRPIEDEWVRNEQVPGILPAVQAALRKSRQERAVLKSLNKTEDGEDSHYDYYYDYDSSCSLVPTLTFLLLGIHLVNLFD